MKQLALAITLLLIPTLGWAAPSEVASGTQAATIGVEHTLTTQTTAANYVLLVDTTNMVAGDILELRIKLKTLTGSSSTLAYLAVFSGAQVDPVKLSVPVPAVWQIVATLKQTAGTGRNYDWSLVRGN